MRKGTLSSTAFGPDIDSPADQLVNEAWEATTPAEQCKLARAALNQDLNAIDAYNILGIHAKTQAERIALFREGVIVGRELFGPIIGDEEMEWWGYMGTRPWMRA